MLLLRVCGGRVEPLQTGHYYKVAKHLDFGVEDVETSPSLCNVLEPFLVMYETGCVAAPFLGGRGRRISSSGVIVFEYIVKFQNSLGYMPQTNLKQFS